MPRLINAKQLADRLGISLRLLEDLIARHAAPKHIWLGRVRRWDPERVEEWLEREFERDTDEMNT